MSNSTEHMLRVLKRSGVSPESGDVVPLTPDINNQHPDLTPSPSMMDLLNLCLSPNQKADNSPLK